MHLSKPWYLSTAPGSVRLGDHLRELFRRGGHLGDELVHLLAAEVLDGSVLLLRPGQQLGIAQGLPRAVRRQVSGPSGTSGGATMALPKSSNDR